MAIAFPAAWLCAALAVGPLENDAKQNGAADDEAGKRATAKASATSTLTTTDKKSILSEYNRQQANGKRQTTNGSGKWQIVQEKRAEKRVCRKAATARPPGKATARQHMPWSLF